MKKLSISKMETVNGGLFDVRKFTAGYCAGVGVISLFTPVAPLALGACAAYGVYSLFA